MTVRGALVLAVVYAVLFTLTQVGPIGIGAAVLVLVTFAFFTLRRARP